MNMIVSKEKQKQIEKKLRKAISDLLDFENEVANTNRNFSALSEEDKNDITEGHEYIEKKWCSKDYFKYLELWSKRNDLEKPYFGKEKVINYMQFNIDYWEEQRKINGGSNE